MNETETINIIEENKEIMLAMIQDLQNQINILKQRIKKNGEIK